MSSAKEIRNKIKSVQSTRKITKAMEMVAASKMRKAQLRMQHARPYVEKVRILVSHMLQANSDYEHPYMAVRTCTRASLIVVTTNKGLCGGLNTNILRLVTQQLQTWQDAKIALSVFCIGAKGEQFFNRIGLPPIMHLNDLGDAPASERLLPLINQQTQAYLSKKIDVVYLGYSRFINTMKQEAVVERLLPLSLESLHSPNIEKKHPYAWDYLYEPNANTVVNELLQRYIEALVYQSVLENLACEQSARMVAMQSASDNAKNIIDEWQLIYNKARQAAITTELSEIVAGAAAIK